MSPELLYALADAVGFVGALLGLVVLSSVIFVSGLVLWHAFRNELAHARRVIDNAPVRQAVPKPPLLPIPTPSRHATHPEATHEHDHKHD